MDPPRYIPPGGESAQDLNLSVRETARVADAGMGWREASALLDTGENCPPFSPANPFLLPFPRGDWTSWNRILDRLGQKFYWNFFLDSAVLSLSSPLSKLMAVRLCVVEEACRGWKGVSDGILGSCIERLSVVGRPSIQQQTGAEKAWAAGRRIGNGRR